MALFDDLFKGNAVTTLAVGLGIAVVAPVILPAAARLSKPLAKAGIKAGIVLYEKGRETIAELGEVAEDIMAEAKAELATDGADPEVTERKAPARKRPARRAKAS